MQHPRRILAARMAMLVLAALGLGPGMAHLLELPVKLHYAPQFYADVTSTLYAGFGAIAAPLQLGAVLAAAVHAWLCRGTRALPLASAGVAALLVSLGVWAAIVAPVNAEWGQALRVGQAAPIYAELRPRWEYGHVAAFAAWFAGYCILLLVALRPADAARANRAVATDASPPRTLGW